MSKPDFVPTVFHPNRKKAVKKLQRLAFGPKDTPAAFRENLKNAFISPFVPNRVKYTTQKAGEIVYEELFPQVYNNRRFIFYVHGGSFIADSHECWRSFCACLAHICSARLFLPNYRPAPSYAFPCALEDLQGVFRSVYARAHAEIVLSGNTQGPEFIIAADGAGASAAMALLFTMKGQSRRAVKRVVLFSPLLDVSPDALVFAKKKNADEILSSEGILASAELYTYIANLKNPLVSPLCAPPENFKNFPPVYIQMGEREIILPDAMRFQAMLAENAVPCVLDVEKNMMHLFQMADEYLAESSLAMERVSRFVLQG